MTTDHAREKFTQNQPRNAEKQTHGTTKIAPQKQQQRAVSR